MTLSKYLFTIAFRIRKRWRARCEGGIFAVRKKKPISE